MPEWPDGEGPSRVPSDQDVVNWSKHAYVTQHHEMSHLGEFE
jgi:hypothetical protein